MLLSAQKGLKDSCWDSFDFYLLADVLWIRQAHVFFSRGLPHTITH